MAAPYAESPVTLMVNDVGEKSNLVSEPYIIMTIALMERLDKL
jgi:hypothetical protein